MINLSIVKTTDTNGATLYTLTPSPVVLGNQDANAVDEVQVEGIPAEWEGLTIRAVFVPAASAAVACILDENGRCTVSESFTGNWGDIVVDAFGENYHAYTTNARYAVARHQDISETVDPEYTPTQIEQILSQAQTYANSAQDARDAAQDAAIDIDTTGYRKIIIMTSSDVNTVSSAGGYFYLFAPDNARVTFLYYPANTFCNNANKRACVFEFDLFGTVALASEHLISTSNTFEYLSLNYHGAAIPTEDMTRLITGAVVPAGVTIKAYGIRA